jgi:hypothetical protein
MRKEVFALAATALMVCATTARAEPAQKVIELFTSQGCSSCPPADRLAAKLAREPGTVLISLPITYWDYLGWKDSFASPAFTERQKAYSKARGDMQVYTPQAVVNGVAHAVGSELDAIDAAAKEGPRPAVSIAESVAGEELRIDVSAGKATEPAQVWLVPVLSSASVAIGRGENAGANVTYINIARGLKKLGDWDGTARQFAVSAADVRQAGADSAAVLLQAQNGGLPGAILGAAIVKLK